MKENCVRKNRVGTAVALAAASLLPCVAVAVEAQSLGVLDPEDATTYLSAGAQIFKGDLVKQGTGTNALSQADIHAGKGRVVVADGVLSLTGATTANQPPKPLSILSNAVVWLDASLPGTIDFVEGSTEKVSQWRDVRETGDGTTANPYLYTRAVSFTNLEHHATYAPDPDGWFPVYQPSVGGANAYVDFGQYSSGRMVLFQDPNGAKKTIQYLRHAFVVLGTQGGHYGFIFNPGSGNAVYVPKWYNLLTECTMYSFIQSSGGWATLPAGVLSRTATISCWTSRRALSKASPPVSAMAGGWLKGSSRTTRSQMRLTAIGRAADGCARYFSSPSRWEKVIA